MAGVYNRSDLSTTVIRAVEWARHIAEGEGQALLNSLSHSSLKGVRAATFDTRAVVVKLFSGSAAEVAAKRLKDVGCLLVAPPESFFVTAPEGPLALGEVERASK
jgi:hypothetical protein